MNDIEYHEAADMLAEKVGEIGYNNYLRGDNDWHPTKDLALGGISLTLSMLFDRDWDEVRADVERRVLERFNSLLEGKE